MELCKREKTRQKFRDLIDKNLNDDMEQKAKEILDDYYTRKMFEFFKGGYTMEQISSQVIRGELLRQYLEAEGK